MFSFFYFNGVFLSSILFKLDDVTNLDMVCGLSTFLVAWRQQCKEKWNGNYEEDITTIFLCLYQLANGYSGRWQPELFQLVAKQLTLILLREQVSKYSALWLTESGTFLHRWINLLWNHAHMKKWTQDLFASVRFQFNSNSTFKALNLHHMTDSEV